MKSRVLPWNWTASRAGVCGVLTGSHHSDLLVWGNFHTMHRSASGSIHSTSRTCEESAHHLSVCIISRTVYK